MKKCDPTLCFADFVKICIESERMKTGPVQYYKGRDYQVAGSLMKDDRGVIYAIFSIKRQAAANVGSGSFKQVNIAVRMNDGEAVARERLKSRQSLQQRAVEREERLRRLFANVKGVIGLEGVASRVSLYKPPKRYWFSRLYQENLDQWMKNPSSREEKIRTASKMRKGVAAIHEKGIFHFDIKPANFLINPGGDVVVADLGFAADRFAVRGTMLYLAPETWRDEVLDLSKVDVWALGVTFYEMFSIDNVRPFWRQAAHQGQIAEWLNTPDFENRLQKQMEIDIPGPENARLREMLTGMLTQDPAQRWTLEEVRNVMAAGL